MVETETGDPMSRRKWVRSSLRHLCGLMRGRGTAPCRGTVGRLLKGLRFSPRASEKRLTGPPNPGRDRQFRHIELTKRRFLKAGLPKELTDDLYADRGYDSEATRGLLRWLVIEPHLAKRKTPHGSGLGKVRWSVEIV